MAKFVLSTPDPSQTQQPQGGGGAVRKFDPIPDGTTVDVEVVEVKKRRKPDWMLKNNPRFEDSISFRFRVTSDDYARRNLWGDADPVFDMSPNCKFRIWIQAILGKDQLPEGFELELDDPDDDGSQAVLGMTGRKARVLVGNRTGRDGTVKDFVQDVFEAKKFEDADDYF
jgi:hypothetical protein